MNGNVRHYEHQAIKYCAWFIDNHILCLFRVCFLYNPHPPSADFFTPSKPVQNYFNK